MAVFRVERTKGFTVMSNYHLIPLLFLMDALFPLYGCMWVQPIVDAISLAAALRFYRRIRENLRAANADA